MPEENIYTSMYSRNAELYHHGILGQKWGQRNGPPYPLDSSVSTGKRLKNTFSKLKEKASNKRETTTSKAIKEAKKMSDEELRTAINRLNLEKQYAEAVKQVNTLNQKNPSLGQKIKASIAKTAKEQFSKTGKTILNAATQEINKKISEAVKKSMDIPLDRVEASIKTKKESPIEKLTKTASFK